MNKIDAKAKDEKIIAIMQMISRFYLYFRFSHMLELPRISVVMMNRSGVSV